MIEDKAALVADFRSAVPGLVPGRRRAAPVRPKTSLGRWSPTFAFAAGTFIAPSHAKFIQPDGREALRDLIERQSNGGDGAPRRSENVATAGKTTEVNGLPLLLCHIPNDVDSSDPWQFKNFRVT